MGLNSFVSSANRATEDWEWTWDILHVDQEQERTNSFPHFLQDVVLLHSDVLCAAPVQLKRS